MIKVKLTDNYTGVQMTGDYNDFDYLYDCIFHVVEGDPKSIEEEIMQNHLFGFLYDIRHAYQGDREVIKEKGNTYYRFNIVLTECLLDVILLKHFVLRNIKSVDYFHEELNYIQYFYSSIIQLLSGILTPIRFNKVKKAIKECAISDAIFCPQWFQMIDYDFLTYKKEKRIKELMKTINAIYNFGDYDEYFEMKIEVADYCKEHNTNVMNVTYKTYNGEIEW